MSTNERENRRSEKKAEKQEKARKIIWAVLLVVVLALLVMKIFELDFSEIKTEVSASVSASDSEFPYTLTDASGARLYTLGGKIAVLSSSMVTVIEPLGAKTAYEFSHGYSSPVMKTSGAYALTFDQGAYKFRLDSAGENIYETAAPNMLLCADVADSGAAVLATTSDYAKSEIGVYSKLQTQKMSYSVSAGYVTAVAISNNGKYVAFAAVHSENAVFTTTVYTMRVSGGEAVAEFTYSGTSVIDLHFVGRNVYVVGADFVSIISALSTEIPVYSAGSVVINAYCYNTADELVVVYSDYSGAAKCSVAYIKKSGKIKCKFDTGLDVKCVSASASYISVLSGECAEIYSSSSGEMTVIADLADSYSSTIMLSSRLYGVRRSNVELILE